MLVSVIVPLFNHLHDLTIPWVTQMQKVHGNWELILVDNGSADGTKEWLEKIKKQDKRIKVILNKTNRGFGGGNNTGYGRAVGDQICFISNDVVIRDLEFLNTFSKVAEKYPNKLLGPMLVKSNQLTEWNNLAVPYLTGFCIFGTKQLFEKLKVGKEVWDEAFGTAYFEDVWLSIRAKDLADGIMEVPLNLIHLGSQSSNLMDIPAQTIYAQAVYRAKMMQRERKHHGGKRIVFFVPQVPYEFIDSDYEGKGVGGAEGSLILLARTLAKMGHWVEIYNKTNITGTFNGVRYANISQFKYLFPCDVFILFRSYHPVLEVVNAKVKLFWSCDQYTDFAEVWNKNIFPNVNRVIAISPYHKNYLNKYYKTLGKVEVIDLGVNWEDYKTPIKKVKHQAIFCSVPHRGLKELLEMMEVIKINIPDFSLVVTSDYRLWGLSTPNNSEFYPMLDKYPFIKFVGKVSRKELVQYQKESEVMAYPSNYDECFCISAMECMAAGAIPVTNDMGALKTTVGKGGFVLSGNESPERYVKYLIRAFDRGEELRKNGYEIAKNHRWEEIAKQWLSLIKNIEENMEEVKYTINSLAGELQVKPMKIKNVLNLARLTAGVTELTQEQVSLVRNALGKEVRVVPDTKLPDKTVIMTKVAVEFGINGNMFHSTPTVTNKGNIYRTEVPYKFLPSAMQIISDSFGDVFV